MNIDEKFPIVVFSTVRSGSTALLSNLHDGNTGLRLFLEPDYGNSEKRMMDFERYFEYSKHFIAKIHAIHLPKYNQNIVNFLVNDNSVFRVRIRRKNIVEQIASLYIAWYRKKLFNIPYVHFNSERITIPLDALPIDNELVRLNTEYVIEANKKLDDIVTTFDMDVWYEDIEYILKFNSKISPTIRPSNYNEIFDAINTYFNQIKT